MKKLSKEDLAKRDAIGTKLNDAHGDLEKAIEKFNEAVTAAWAEVTTKVEEYNATIEEANSWQEEIQSAIDDFVSEKSEKWQEGDAAAQYESWKDSFEPFDAIDIDEPDELEVPENYTETLEGRPAAVDEA